MHAPHAYWQHIWEHEKLETEKDFANMVFCKSNCQKVMCTDAYCVSQGKCDAVIIVTKN